MAREGNAINPASAPATAQYSQAIRMGNTIYCAGQTGVDARGNVVGPDIKSQATQAFKNLETVLREAGATMDDVVKITVFLTDRNDRPVTPVVMNKVTIERKP